MNLTVCLVNIEHLLKAKEPDGLLTWPQYKAVQEKLTQNSKKTQLSVKRTQSSHNANKRKDLHSLIVFLNKARESVSNTAQGKSLNAS
jgi:hypothetical protein